MATFDCLGDVLDYLLDDAHPNGEDADAREDDAAVRWDGDPQTAPFVDDLAPGDREVPGKIPF